jgi:phage gp36-like protein
MLGVMNSSEADAYQAAVTGDGQDPLADATAAVVNQCRGYIADYPLNSLAAGLTLPERCHLSAMHMIRVELLTRLDLEVSADRASAKREAIRFFERVAEGKVTLEQPDTVDTTEAGGAATVETLNSRGRVATRASLSGL